MASKQAYLIGIKGVGMAALAVYLKQAGYDVTGSDVADKFVTDELLEKNAIAFFNSFDGKNIGNQKYELIIASAAYDKENPEIKEAVKRKLNLKYYSEVLGQISKEKSAIAVAGIHGKTTTSAMLSFILEKAGLDPSYIIGAGEVSNHEAPAHFGQGDYFVIEADEYRKSPTEIIPKFLDLTPKIAIISSIELDHPDMFPTIDDVYNAFYSLACRVPRSGFIVLCIDYAKAKKLQSSLADRNFETYGFDPTSKWRVMNAKSELSGTTFNLESQGQIYGPFQIQLPGNHNILNATAAIICALKIGVKKEEIINILKNFKSVKRRYEEIGTIGKIKIIDDYAHHPTAISSTIEATKRKFKDYKIWCVFQPHTFSRTEKLLEEFSLCFKGSDNVIVTDIFASAREGVGNITAIDLANEIKKHQSKVRYLPYGEKIVKYLFDNVKEPAVILTIGAGNIYQIAIDIKNSFQKRNKSGKK